MKASSKQNSSPGSDTKRPDARSLLVDAQKGDEEARTEFIESNMGLIFEVIKRFRGRGYENDVLIQEGSIGLLKALDRFDTERGYKFSTYAVPLIIGEIKRFIRDDQPVKTGRKLKTNASRIMQKKQELQNRLGREPDISLLEEELEMSREEIVYALDAVKNPLSLEYEMFDEGEKPILLRERIESKEEGLSQEDKMDLYRMLDQLNERERLIIEKRFFEEKTQEEIGDDLDLSQVQISRLEKKVLKKIRGLYKDSGDVYYDG